MQTLFVLVRIFKLYINGQALFPFISIIDVGKHLKIELALKLKSVYFSIIMDETTDVSVSKQLAIMVEFYDIDKSNTIVELLDLVQCDNGKAETLLHNLVSLLKK